MAKVAFFSFLPPLMAHCMQGKAVASLTPPLKAGAPCKFPPSAGLRKRTISARGRISLWLTITPTNHGGASTAPARNANTCAAGGCGVNL